ncbi:AMP-binding protein [Paraglaciecola sp. L1A13]|uniref:AMP-binding protein n=1 Tax=Paraglaciecola sp. L1A13 TaxID=2686359 RepID=UPI00351AA4D2
MFLQSGSFKLIEHGESYEAKDFSYSKAPSLMEYIELSGTRHNSQQNLVVQMLQAIIDGISANIPVIFNRSNQGVNFDKLPKEFCIGLFTSGTTGPAKLVFHFLHDLMPNNKRKSEAASCWLLCYHPMSYAGLQVILQVIVANDVLVADVDANVRQKAQLAIEHQVNALSATPSFIRALLLCWQKTKPIVHLISLGGEIADQGTLDAVKSSFPDAALRHIYATTESGVIFSVKDDLAGFPKKWLQASFNGWHIQIKDTLILVKDTCQIDTGDCVAVTEDRVLFTGRRDNVVNVGGAKVNLEDIERQLIQLEHVRDARVFVKANPITGALVCAEICSVETELAKQAINFFCQQLAAEARPRIVTYCEQLTLTPAGKKQRCL